MLSFRLKLCAVDPELHYFWEAIFKNEKGVSSHLSSIVNVSGDTLVSPANSFGFMDGGIDQLYTDIFGEQLQNLVQMRIQKYYFGEIPVGQSFVVDLPKPYKKFKRIIIAPTMRVPEHISGTLNAYHAFRAILMNTLRHNLYATDENQIKELLCPGLGTGIGALSAETCAKQMKAAYDQIMGMMDFPKSVFEAFLRNEELHKY